MKFEWETICDFSTDDEQHLTYRAKVWGGWLVKDVSYDLNLSVQNNQLQIVAMSVNFIPDPRNEWGIE